MDVTGKGVGFGVALKWLGIEKDEWRLGDRVENAPTFDKALLGNGDEEEERRKVATGLASFDGARAKSFEEAAGRRFVAAAA